MKIDALLKSLESSNTQSLEFALNESTPTWQMSHVWLICGIQNVWRSLEEFYLAGILKHSPFKQGHVNQPDWSERVKLLDWCRGLEIENIPVNNMLSAIESARAEALENKDEWEESFKIDNFKINSEIRESWNIKETITPRFEVGATLGQICKTSNEFYYLERHWES